MNKSLYVLIMAELYYKFILCPFFEEALFWFEWFRVYEGALGNEDYVLWCVEVKYSWKESNMHLCFLDKDYFNYKKSVFIIDIFCLI